MANSLGLMKLYGSKTSPYVRRIRLLLANHSYELIECDIFSDEGRAKVAKITPIVKIPFLEADGLTIFDSHNIYDFLIEKGLAKKLNWEDRNQIAVIDGLTDSLIQVLLLKRSQMALDSQTFLAKSQAVRMAESLQYLESVLENKRLTKWEYPAICLFAVLDWSEFRELLTLDEKKYPALKSFLVNSRDLPAAISTNPRG